MLQNPGLLPGTGLINCLYINRELNQLWVIDYRIYDRTGNGKSKLYHFADMLFGGSEVQTTCFCQSQTWIAGMRLVKLMAMIDGLGKIYYCPLKKNRLVEDTGGVSKYKQMEKVQ